MTGDIISLTQVRCGNREETHRLHLDEEVFCPHASDGVAYDQPCSINRGCASL